MACWLCVWISDIFFFFQAVDGIRDSSPSRGLGDVYIFFFKQKTAYEIMPSLVGSEMCIRDREDKYGIPVYETHSYGLKDEETTKFFAENTFELGISMGWQRLLPGFVLSRFSEGVFGFHGNCAYLPFGRGRSPLNWSIILGDTRFNLNLFQYDEKADSPNVFASEMCAITPHDTVRTMQYKNMLAVSYTHLTLPTIYSV